MSWTWNEAQLSEGEGEDERRVFPLMAYIRPLTVSLLLAPVWSVSSSFLTSSQIICIWIFIEKRETCSRFWLRNISVRSSVSSMETGVENLWRCADWNQLTFVVNTLVLHEAYVLAHITLWLNSEFQPNAIRVVHTFLGRTKAASLQKVGCTWQTESWRWQPETCHLLHIRGFTSNRSLVPFMFIIFIIDLPTDFSRSQ